MPAAAAVDAFPNRRGEAPCGLVRPRRHDDNRTSSRRVRSLPRLRACLSRCLSVYRK